jgi:hypothetical protein
MKLEVGMSVEASLDGRVAEQSKDTRKSLWKSHGKDTVFSIFLFCFFCAFVFPLVYFDCSGGNGPPGGLRVWVRKAMGMKLR